MKQIIPLLLLGSAAATRLGTSNIGVEEVGDQIEFFPEELPDREELLARARRLEAKEYAPDLDLVELTGDSEAAPAQNTRREAVSCNDNQAKVEITLKTDNFGYETSYVIKNDQNVAVLNAPGQGSRFGSKQTYTEEVCLKSGQYTLRLKDKGSDGMGGSIVVKVDGMQVLNVANTNQSFSVVEKKFSVSLFSGRNSFMGGNNSAQTFSGDSGFVSKSCYNVKVYALIDDFGKETTFKITKNGQSGAVWKDEKSLGANEEKTFNVGCLEPGDYELTVTDIDGLCCKNGDGEYKLIIEGEDLIKGGSFSGQESHTFKVGHDWGAGMESRDWEYLIAHNDRRQDYHTRCNDRYCDKKYRPLKWSAGLAADAKQYAKQLLDTCDTTGIKHESGIEQGENLAKNKGFGEWGQLYPADKIVKRFVDNEAKWAWTKNAHLTQALWYPTRYLGCAESVKTMDNGATCRMQVCRYAKAGNCQMGKFDSHVWPNHESAMMQDDSPCGPMCPPEGCYI